MSAYGGPNPNIADGNALSAADVQDSFDRFATAANAVDESNVGDKEVLTYRSIHPESLTQTFRQGQLIYGEPAAWVAVGRGGVSGSEATRFSLGPRENLYTVDGCSLRVSINESSRAFVHSFIQVESIKVANVVTEDDDFTATDKIETIDLSLTFKLKRMLSGDTHSSATTLDTVVKKMKIGAFNTGTGFYDSGLNRRRGFTVELSDDVTLSSVDDNGTAFDFFVTVESEITAAKTDSHSDAALATANYNNHLFLAHLRSYSRYTTARVFLK